MLQTSITDAAAHDLMDALRTEPGTDALRKIARIRDELARTERSHVEVLRANGYSWTEIGAALGTSKQAAYQRFR
jgi:hypothetical protein